MSKDKPFRELQFSSTQLVVVFLGILVLGVFIFLLGISVGKKQGQLAAGAGTPAPAKTETVAPKTPVSPDAATAAKPEENHPPVGEAAVAPNNVTTAVKPADNKPADAKPSPDTGKPAAIAPNDVTPTAKLGGAADKTAPAAAKTAASKAPAAKSGATTEAKDAKPKGRFYVQIGAVTDKPAAKLFGERVELLGFPSRVLDPLATDKKTVFRVRIGPYETKAEADDAQGKLAATLKKKKTDFFIVVD
jgi:cell division septation protein DedD